MMSCGSVIASVCRRSALKTSSKRSVPKVVQIRKIPQDQSEVPEPVDDERLLGRRGRARLA